MRRRIAWLVLPVVASMALTACGGGSGGASSSSGSSGDQTVTIGYLANLTGAGATFGVPFNNGFKLALQNIQKNGTLSQSHVKLAVSVQDTNSQVANAVTIFNKFASAGYPITVSDSLSPIEEGVAPIANSQKIVFLSGGGSKPPNNAGYSFYLADLISPLQGLGAYMGKKGSKRVAVIVDGDNPAFPTLAGILQKSFSAAGGSDFVTTQTISEKDSDFSSVLTNIAKANPDTIVLEALPQQSGNILRQIKQNSSLSAMANYGTVGWGTDVATVAGDAATGVVFPAAWAPGTEGSQNFETQYQAAYHNAPQAYSAIGYETGWWIAAAVQKVASAGGKITSQALRDAMSPASTSSLVSREGVIPGFSIGTTGAPKYPGTLAEYTSSGAVQKIG